MSGKTAAFRWEFANSLHQRKAAACEQKKNQVHNRSLHVLAASRTKDFVLVAMAVQEQVVEFLIQREADLNVPDISQLETRPRVFFAYCLRGLPHDIPGPVRPGCSVLWH